MRPVVAALLSFLFSTSAMAATFTYVPVHVAPVVHIPPPVHIAPPVHVQPMVRPALSTVRPGATVVKPGPWLGRHHPVAKPVPVTVYVAPPNRVCAHPKPGEKDCGRK